jgi:hypothetical protein
MIGTLSARAVQVRRGRRSTTGPFPSRVAETFVPALFTGSAIGLTDRLTLEQRVTRPATGARRLTLHPGGVTVNFVQRTDRSDG